MFDRSWTAAMVIGLAASNDVLEVETRGFKGPRAYDELGLPLHFDNQSVFKERIYRDKADPNIMHDVTPRSTTR